MSKEENMYSAPNSDVSVTRHAAIRTPGIKEIFFGFSGRLNRQRYWIAYLVLTVAMFAVFAILAGAVGPDGQPSPLMLVLYIPIIWVGLAFQIKRFHDRDKSGWWVLLGFVPVIGPLWLFVELGFLSGDEGANRFGPPVI